MIQSSGIRTGRWIGFAVVVILGGCGGGDQAGQIKAAQETLAAGQEAYNRGDYETAAEMLGQACDHGGLLLEVYVDASTKRAIALAHTGEFDAAIKVLDHLAQGAPNMDEVHAAKSYVFRKQGNQAAADSEFAKAKQINPHVQVLVK